MSLTKWLIVAIVVTVALAEDGTEIIDETTPLSHMVTEPLEFMKPLHNMERLLGTPVTLECKIKGQPPLNLFVVYDRIETARRKSRKRTLLSDTIYDPEHPDELEVRYVIPEFKRKHVGIYRCQAESINGQPMSSVAELNAIDPCESITCGALEECVTRSGYGICTCDFPCSDEDDYVCAGGQNTFKNECHHRRWMCRKGGDKVTDEDASTEPGMCPDTVERTESTCTMYGEGHVTRFNNDYFSFRGNCAYKMVEDRRDGGFIVYTRTNACGDNNAGVCLRAVTIYIDRAYGFSLERGWLINDDGKSRKVTANDTLVLGNGRVEITRVGEMMEGYVPEKGIRFHYDGLQFFSVTVPSEFVQNHDDFKGFCGEVPVTISSSTVGKDAGEAGEIKKLPGLSRSCESEILVNQPTCKMAVELENGFEQSDDFEACKSLYPLSVYNNHALLDVCKCDVAVELNYCFCNIAFAYADKCRREGFNVNISPDYCDEGFHKKTFKQNNIFYRRHRGRKH